MTGDLSRGLAEQEAGLAMLRALPAAERARLRAIRDYLGDPLDPDYGLGTLALSLTTAGRFAEARATAERVVAVGPGRPDAARSAANLVHADLTWSLISTYAALGQPEAARWAAAQARSQFRAAGHHKSAGGVTTSELLWVVLPYQ